MSDTIFYQFDCGDGSIASYDLKTTTKEPDNTVVELRYSENDVQWAPEFRGKIGASFRDNGNEIMFYLEDGSKTRVFNLDYSQLDMVLALIDYHDNHTGSQFRTTLRKFKEITDDQNTENKNNQVNQ